MRIGSFDDGIDAIEKASLLRPITHAARVALAIADHERITSNAGNQQ